MTRTARNAARVAATATPLLVLVEGAAPAVADTPSTWERPEPMSALTALLIFVGIPLALFAVISLLAYAPTLMRRERDRRGVASWTEPEWFGGEVRRGGTAELESGEPASSERQPGGASAGW